MWLMMAQKTGMSAKNLCETYGFGNYSTFPLLLFLMGKKSNKRTQPRDAENSLPLPISVAWAKTRWMPLQVPMIHGNRKRQGRIAMGKKPSTGQSCSSGKEISTQMLAFSITDSKFRVLGNMVEVAVIVKQVDIVLNGN
jgi:hypothetical protein